ncbi:histidine phosphatase family protein [Halobacillus sp. A5]|uniref:histidine phosphatase family protein n=1 Tax=Halobacillus sp. A5 TaxID=2880263 RepID=UPI0020A6237C|nr:histidine phosphatase family protein [Halobacillus sp. A5]MCP3027117.1 histidine phosphatase family protein [Halobacillus sp. A5]
MRHHSIPSGSPHLVQWYRPSLLSRLKEGGYVLYARHAEASVGEDLAYVNFADCSTQRNLSDRGRRQAAAYGSTLRSLQIPLAAPALTSPFCRNRETAVLAFGEENVQVDPFWLSIYSLGTAISSSEKQTILNELTRRLETPPPEGVNTIIVAHSFPEGAGLGEIPNMGTVIVKPFGEGRGYELVARPALEDWMNLGSGSR